VNQLASRILCVHYQDFRVNVLMRSITGLDNFNKHGESDDAYLSLRKFVKIQMSRSENKNNIPRGYVEWNNLTLRFIQFSRHKRNKLFYIKRHFYFPFCIATVISCFRLWIFQKERIKLDVSYILKFFRTITERNFTIYGSFFIHKSLFA